MVSRANYQAEFFVPNTLSESERGLLGKFIVQQIIDNCNNNIDKNGKPFRKYSEEYIDSLDFKIADKSKSDVNLQLTGDMLASIEVIKNQSGLLVIGYPVGSEYAGQVEGNQLVNGRWFLGLPKSQLNLLVAKVQSQSPRDMANTPKVDSLVQNILKRFL